RVAQSATATGGLDCPRTAHARRDVARHFFRTARRCHRSNPPRRRGRPEPTQDGNPIARRHGATCRYTGTTCAPGARYVLAHTSHHGLSWEHISLSGDFLWDRAAATAGKTRAAQFWSRRVAARAPSFSVRSGLGVV